MLEIQHAEKILRQFSKLRSLTISQAQVLTHVALHPGVSGTAIADHLDLRQRTVSSALAVLGTAGVRGGRQGLGLLVGRINEHDSRYKLFTLTDLGEFFMRGLER